MTLSLIVAMTEDRVIGRDNELPWHLSEDLQRFKKITMGHPIIMGRKTYDSIGKPLPGRQNIVVTRDLSKKIEGVTVVNSLDQAIQRAGGEEAFVIGGAAIFKEALPKADRLYLTLIHKKIAGDVYFPEIDLVRDFKVVEQSRHESLDGKSKENVAYSFVTVIPK